MISEIQNGLATLKSLKGVRNFLWAALLVGLSLVLFESVTQYFAFSDLRTKVELLDMLSKLESKSEDKQELQLLHSELIEEAKNIYHADKNPGPYLLNLLLRFFQGAYLSLPLFYFLFKAIVFFAKHSKDELKGNKKLQQMSIMIGSFVFSAAVWMATILGAASVLWNKSGSLLVSWLVFPFLSALIMLVVTAWLVSLRIMLPGKKKTETEKVDE